MTSRPDEKIASPVQRVVVSILNWNSASLTLQCVKSVLKLCLSRDMTMSVTVIDNGSAAPDYQKLSAGLLNSNVNLVRSEVNLGFAGGHNLAISQALTDGTDFIWLLNSDAVSAANTLNDLLEKMSLSPKVGAISPLIVRLGQPDVVDFAGAVHDWSALDSQRPLDMRVAKSLNTDRPQDIWVVGTAILFRCAALREVGMLDDQYFAYYEDDDICARLSLAGWQCAVSFDSVVEHACFDGVVYERPAYYFYLMARNGIRFWRGYTPAGKRRLLVLRLLENWLFMANKLKLQKMDGKADACLLGIADGLFGRYGRPDLNRPVPAFMRVLRWVRERSHAHHFRSSPAANIASH